MIVRVLAGLSVVPFLLGAASVPAGREHVVFRFEDPRINESSALVPLPGGLFATTNDSGDTGRVFVVDRSGATVGVTHWAENPVDTEALAPDGHGDLWVGDIGDNAAERRSVQVAKVPVGRGDRAVRPTVYDLTYPDHPRDAETLLCDPRTGRLYVASKEWAGGTLYAAPRRLAAHHPNRLRPVAPVLPIATDGAFLPDGRHVIVRGYFSAAVYAWPSMRRVTSFPLPSQPQGEGIGIAADGTVYVSSEGVHSQVLRVPLPAPAEAAMSPTPSPSATAHPGSSAALPDRGSEETQRSWWPWALGGLVGLAALGVLLRSLRPR